MKSKYWLLVIVQKIRLIHLHPVSNVKKFSAFFFGGIHRLFRASKFLYSKWEKTRAKGGKSEFAWTSFSASLTQLFVYAFLFSNAYTRIQGKFILPGVKLDLFICHRLYYTLYRNQQFLELLSRLKLKIHFQIKPVPNLYFVQVQYVYTGLSLTNLTGLWLCREMINQNAKSSNNLETLKIRNNDENQSSIVQGHG